MSIWFEYLFSSIEVPDCDYRNFVLTAFTWLQLVYLFTFKIACLEAYTHLLRCNCAIPSVLNPIVAWVATFALVYCQISFNELWCIF